MIDAAASFWVVAAHAWWTVVAPISVQATILAVVVKAVESISGRHMPSRFVGWLHGLVAARFLLPPEPGSPVSITRLLWSEAASTPVSGPSSAPGTSPVMVLFSVWCVGFVIFVAAAVHRSRRVRREWLEGVAPAPRELVAAARRAAARIRLRTLPRIAVRSDEAMPAVVGVLRPTVVLPASLAGGAVAPHRVEHVLLHELGHVRRRDSLRSAGVLAIQLLYWFHPAAWWMRRRLEFYREVRCDELVVRSIGGDVRAYGRTLLELSGVTTDTPSARLSFLGTSRLRGRLDWLTRSPSRRPRLRAATAAALLASVVLTCLPLPRRRSQPFVASPPQVVANLPPGSLAEPRTIETPPVGADLPGCLALHHLILAKLAEAESLAAR